MKNNTVKEGYKFWAIYCTATGFCYKVLPAARVGNTNEEGKKVTESTHGLILLTPNSNKNNYVVGMDSFLTFPWVLIGAREISVAAIGTAKASTKGYQ